MKIILSKKNIILLIYGIFILIVANPYSNTRVFHTFERILPYVNLLVVFIGLASVMMKNNAKEFFLISFGGILFLLLHFINGSSFGNIAGFVSLIFAIMFFASKDVTDDMEKIFAILGVIYLLLCLSCSNRYYHLFLNGENVINPNIICIFICWFSAFENTFFSERKKILVIYNLLSIYTIYKFGSRTSLFTFVLYLILSYLLPLDFWKNKKRTIMVITLIFAFGFIFPLLYITASTNLINMIENITGKSFYSGREVIWGRFYKDLLNPINLIFGPGSDMESVYTTLNIFGRQAVFSMHSSYLGLLLDYGLVGTVYFYYFICRTVLNAYNKSVSDKQIMGLFGLLMILIIGYAEVAFTYSYFVLFIAAVVAELYKDENNEMEDVSF